MAPAVWLLRRGGPRLAHLGGLLLAPLALALLPGLRPVLDGWWRRVRPAWPGDRRQAAALRHLAAFARMCADRICAYSHPRDVCITTTPREARIMRTAMARGCVLLSAHVGAWELGGRLLARLGGKPVHAVMLAAEDPRVRTLVDAAMGDTPPRLINPRQGPGAARAVAAALAAGETVGFLGDRVLPSQRAIPVPLLGGPVRVPSGPFLMAAAAGVPVLPCFLIELRPGLWHLRVEQALSCAWTPGAARRERRLVATLMAQAWAVRLAAVAVRHPHQWWNFHDLWKAAARTVAQPP
jgi:predicted LPLAT superfamily acyltransferase